MLKSSSATQLLLLLLVSLIDANPHHLKQELSSSSSSSMTTFLKPKANIMRRLNPLKLLFTVAHSPRNDIPYSVEWNLSALKTMFLESTHVPDEDKALFIAEFSNFDNDYDEWSPEKHDQLERFTEKYLNPYRSVESFLPLADCQAFTYALTDEMLNDLQPGVPERKRAEIRAKTVKRLCDEE
jgi:hypothetical protein